MYNSGKTIGEVCYELNNIDKTEEYFNLYKEAAEIELRVMSMKRRAYMTESYLEDYFQESFLDDIGKWFKEIWKNFRIFPNLPENLTF